MDRFLFRHGVLAASVVLLSMACTTPPPPMPDGGGDDAATADVVTDTPDPPYNSALFGRCRSNDDCAAGSTCKTEAASGWSNGYCTRTCTTSSDCEAGAAAGTSGYCGMHDGEQICLRECLNGFDCGRVGFNCAQVNPADTSQMPLRVCRPSCTDTSCVQGTRCNPWTGRCQPLSAPLPPAGSDVGEPCARMGTTNNCRSGQCIAAQGSTGTYTGWNNGYCSATCTLPAGWNSSTLWPETTFPRGNCPMGSLCFPDFEPGFAERDPGTCLRECRTNTDCRGGESYYCRKTFTRGNNRPFTWQNGFCWPAACDPSPTATDTCASGYYCEPQIRIQGGMRVTVGVCRPGSRTEPTVEPGPEPSPEPTIEPSPEPTIEAGAPADATMESGSDSSPDSESDASDAASSMDGMG